MAAVSVNGARLHVERRGSGPPLLLITGFAISSAVFEPVLDRYAASFECISYDNRGAGRTRAPRRPTSMPELAADAAGLLAALGIDSAHVYGVSMGGMVAQELALRFPERVRGLVLGGTTPGGPRAIRPTLGELSALVGGISGTRDRASWLAGALFSPEFRREQPERVAELLAYFARHRATPDGVLWHWWASVYHDTTSRLAQIQAPTLVMHGERDALAPIGNARLLARRIPDARLAIVPGAGHAYALEAPETSFRLLAEWLDAREPITAGRPREGLVARAEPLTRALGLPLGALRSGGSLAGAAVDLIRKPRLEKECPCGG
ncbi:MAG TPA: alpha/beta hydrolase [Solirubrobacteraceae bacterium]|nr:alpha/beta hydrolase [Solirubrobacteraceae bacterium]